MKAFGYFSDAAADGATLAEQNKSFLDFCARAGYDAGDTFVEPAHPNGHAAGFRQLVASLRRSAAEAVVVVPAVSSLATNPRDAVLRCYQIMALGAHVAAIDAGGPAREDELLASLHDAASEGAGERVRAAMRRKAVKGEVLGRPPYGYKVGARRRLELVPEEAVVVRYIFRLYLQEQMGIRLIARRLNEEGLKTRRGGNWSMVSIRDILRNRAYLGTYSRFGVRVPGSHPPLVLADDFREVQDRLNARRTSYAPRVASRFLLSGLAHCGYCGNRLIGVTRKQSWKRRDGAVMSNSYRYYQCESRTNQSVCGYHTRRATDLESAVRSALTEAVCEAREHDGAVPMNGHAPAAAEAELQRLRARVRTIDRRFDGQVAAAAKGRLSSDRLQTIAQTAARDRLAVEDAIEALELRSAVVDGGGAFAHAADTAERWESLEFDALHQALRDAVSRITVTDDSLVLELGS